MLTRREVTVSMREITALANAFVMLAERLTEIDPALEELDSVSMVDATARMIQDSISNKFGNGDKRLVAYEEMVKYGIGDILPEHVCVELDYELKTPEAMLMAWKHYVDYFRAIRLSSSVELARIRAKEESK